MANLTWGDIFVDVSVLDFQQLAALWPHTISGRLRPIGASAFGDLFFEIPSGEVQKLDVLEGGCHVVAANFEEFGLLMNTASWREESLLTEGVALLMERGQRLATNQFYGFAPHPSLTGSIRWDSVMVMDAPVWHSICAQLLDAN